MQPIATFQVKKQQPVTGNMLQGTGSGISLQGNTAPLQGSSPKLQGSSPQLQVTANPADYMSLIDPNAAGVNDVLAESITNPSAGSTAKVDPDAARRAALLDSLTGKRSSIEEAYAALFGNLDTLLKSRSGELDTQYGDQFKKAGQDFADVMPAIDSSYAALGSYDSTQRGDNRAKAQKGYEDTTRTIGLNKEKDLALLGQYGNESKAKFQADKDAAMRYVDSSANTTDVNALQEANNNLDTNLSQTGVTKATLGTNASAANTVRNMTSDNGRFQQAIDALDAIVKGSMPNNVKAAAVKAVSDNAGLSNEEKAKVQATYGNVYAEQATL